MHIITLLKLFIKRFKLTIYIRDINWLMTNKFHETRILLKILFDFIMKYCIIHLRCILIYLSIQI